MCKILVNLLYKDSRKTIISHTLKKNNMFTDNAFNVRFIRCLHFIILWRLFSGWPE